MAYHNSQGDHRQQRTTFRTEERPGTLFTENGCIYDRNIHPQILTVPRLRSIEDIPPIFTLRTYSSPSDTESFNRESSPKPSAPPMEDPTPPIARRTRSHRIKTPLTEETYM
ncbi:Hypothetical predicted protein [Mytilus galloprovincialis]|uniref:Uncharacterized protein n=1 Tax=Mytilus galloprovincialis TaxID=29158 RepID=A0A8B6EWR4_MYTGA|nr:Hypothetical predicted protein [Mytilus galloprovincialis]